MKTSIIIAVRNKLDYTRLCIESIRTHTKAGSYELIVIDNHSKDDTIEWLRAQPDIRVVRNERNLGFPKACNQGIGLATGDAILLLNNDTVATANWLDGLLACLNSDETIGAVGPITNHCSYFQSIPVSYGSIDDMQRFAASHNVSDPDKWEERLKLIGFCLLIRRSVVDQVGLLDERFTPGNYEDDDYSYRIRKAGYRLMLCMDTFIHHFGSTTWEDEAAFRELLRTNQGKFREKWSFIPEYANAIRFELIDRIRKPAEAELRILDIGCRGGGTLLLARNRFKRAELYGIEPDPREAEYATWIGASIQVAEPLQALSKYPERFFDVILLPHELRNDAAAAQLIAAARRCLKPDGQVIGALPNRLFHRRLKAMIQGAGEGMDTGFLLAEAVWLPRSAGLGYIVVNGSVLPKEKEDEESIRQLAALGGGEPQTYEIAAFIIFARSEDAEYYAITDILENRHAAWHIEELSGQPPERIIALVEQRFERPGEVLRTLGAAYLDRGEIGKGLAYMNRAMVLSPQTAASSSDPAQAGAESVLEMEQNDVPFTGERLVINKLVKERFHDVLEEHLARYELAARYVMGKRVLDAACGAGYGSLMLLQAGAQSIIGVDISEACVQSAMRDYGREAIEFVTSDILALDYPDGSFEAIISFETIEHIPDGSAWIQESARLLADGGLFIVSTPNRYVTNPGTYFGEQPHNPHHRFEYSLPEFVGELLQHYDLVELYGQRVASDRSGPFAKFIRPIRGLNTAMDPDNDAPSAELVPLCDIKDGQAMYHVAVCRKKMRG